MKISTTRNYKKSTQYVLTSSIILTLSLCCYFSSHLIGYKIVALVLLMTVSLIAMLFDIIPVLISALLSGLIWNFFFIPPVFNFHINHTEDVLMFLSYFIVACINTVLTFQIRKQEKKVRDKEEKEKAILLYNTLLNSLSHELKTPIATIIGSIDALKENRERLSLSHQVELLNQIDTASLRLNRQVENLLNMSRLESGMLKPKYDWCDVNELIYSIIQKIEIPSTHSIQFVANEQLPLFKLDRGLIEQVLLNLIYNAIQYTDEQSTIQLIVSQEKDNCIFIVSDNGKGIPENEREIVFDKFYRLPHTKTGGTGLGLSIVKGFVEAHHGKIMLEESEEKGARFVIEIPAETSYLTQLKNE